MKVSSFFQSLRALPILAVSLFSLIAPPVWAQEWKLTPLALRGSAAPDSGTGTTFLNFSKGTMNAAGDVAFVATLTGSTIGVANDAGIYLAKNGALSLVLRRGGDVPGLADGSKLADLSVPFTDVILAGDGSMLIGSVTRKNSVAGFAVITGQPGALQLTALASDAAPGTEQDTIYGAISRLCYTENGKIGFLAQVTGPNVPSGGGSVIYTGTHGALAVAARTGQTAPNAGGATFLGFPPTLLLNNEGRFTLPCTLTGTGVTTNSTHALYAGLPGNLTLIARQGSSGASKFYAGSPGAIYQSAGGRILFDFALSSTGDIADAGGVDVDRALFGGTPGDIAAVVRSFDPGPGETGIVLRPGANGILTASSVLNDAGTIAVNATLIGTTQDNPYSNGVYVGTRGNLALLARSGQRAPGTPNGVVFQLVGANEINESGDVLLDGFLAGTGVTAANDEGFWVGKPGNLQLVVREGMTIDVGAGVKKTIATVRSIQDFQGIGGRRNGRTSGFNEARQVFLALTFTDNTSGLFRADVDLTGTATTLTVTVAGNGKVSAGYLGATPRTVGKKYTVTAKPDAGQLFDGWTGDLTSANPKLTLTMTPDLTLQANFIANPFIAVAGNYAGLIATTPATFAGGGQATLKVMPTGAFTGTVVFGGRSFRVKGAFDNTGHVTFGIPKTTITVTLNLALGWSPRLLTGTVTEGAVTASVTTN
ncbi:MAG: choice-of-anchor tandem repeat NxxGxxAF-containing protein, partial [Chthoniobacteraceae bacterium]